MISYGNVSVFIIQRNRWNAQLFFLCYQEEMVWGESSWEYGMGEVFCVCCSIFGEMSLENSTLWVLQYASVGAGKRMVAQAIRLQINFAAGLRPRWWLWKGEIRSRFLICWVLLTFQMAPESGPEYALHDTGSPLLLLFLFNLKVTPLSFTEAFLLVTDAFLLLSILPCNTGFINVSTEFFPYSSEPDGDKKDFCFKNYLPLFLPWPPPTKEREGINLRPKVFQLMPASQSH